MIRKTLLLAFMLSMGVYGCLPESETLDQDSFSRVQGTANAMASSANQFSLQLQSAITRSDLWQTSQLPEGSFAALTNQEQINLGLNNLTAFTSGEMGAGYCDLDPANNSENNALVTWFNNANGGDFVVKGLGDNASSYILQALSATTAPENIGMNNGTTVSLAGPRRSNNQDTVDLANCNLGIPDGVPVVFYENIYRKLNVAGADAVTVFETVTEDCPNGDIGSIMTRTAYLVDPVTGVKTLSTSIAPDVVNTCAGASATLSNSTITTRPVNVASAMMGTMTANGMSAGDLAVALNDLSSIDCKETTDGVLGSNQNSVDEFGNPLQTNQDGTPKTIKTCDTSGLGNGITMVQEISSNDTGQEIQTMNATVNCNAGDLTPLSGQVFGVTGTAIPQETWRGTVEFDRGVIGQEASGLQQASASTTVGMRGSWKAGNVDCSRNETMDLTCDQMFPQYSGSNFTLVRGGGASFARTNRITTWADPVTYTLDTGLAADQGWTMTSNSIDCAWVERDTFVNCPSGFTSSVTGVRERDIDVTGTNLSAVTISNYRLVTASQCTRVTQSGSACF